LNVQGLPLQNGERVYPTRSIAAPARHVRRRPNDDVLADVRLLAVAAAARKLRNRCLNSYLHRIVQHPVRSTQRDQMTQDKQVDDFAFTAAPNRGVQIADHGLQGRFDYSIESLYHPPLPRSVVYLHLRVLDGLPSDSSRGVPLLVGCEFCPGCLDQIDVEHVSETHEVTEDVRQLVLHCVCRGRHLHGAGSLVRRKPLEQGHQLTHLTAERHDEILGRVELPRSVTRARVGRRTRRGAGNV